MTPQLAAAGGAGVSAPALLQVFLVASAAILVAGALAVGSPLSQSMPRR